ncbi:MAG: HAMP domain-containing protein, partial [Candidatus Omnitrophica bacterium]|nr:HAMP domain-containing protein [Candidatus Omnitrophota bacterium]
MGRFRTRLVFSILLLTLFTSLSYLSLAFLISNDILEIGTVDQFCSVIFISGIVITCLTIIAAALVSFFLSRRISRPISELVKATQAVSKRNFGQHIKIRSYREIEELISSFNYMSEQLRSFQGETKRHNQSLEKIAREKVRELSCIYRIGREVSSTLELNKVLDSIVRRTTEVLNLKVCTILLREGSASDKLKVWRGQGINLKRIEKQ